MNFVAHVEVAHRLAASGARRPPEDSPDRARATPLMVGAALPDLAAMGGFRLEPAARSGDLGEGIRLHHRTDDVFHADGRVRELMARLRNALLAAGMSRGAARACGHVGVELLLDGHLLEDPRVTRRTAALLTAVGRPSPELATAVAAADRDRWVAHLDRVARHIAPESYRATALVARRLHHILASRPRLAFAEADVALLAGALRRIRPAVAEAGEDVMDGAARGVADRAADRPAATIGA